MALRLCWIWLRMWHRNLTVTIRTALTALTVRTVHTARIVRTTRAAN